MNTPILADRIKKIRAEAQLNQRRFASLINTTQPTVCNWEAGRSEPRPFHLVKIAKLAQISVDELLSDLDLIHPPQSNN